LVAKLQQQKNDFIHPSSRVFSLAAVRAGASNRNCRLYGPFEYQASLAEFFLWRKVQFVEFRNLPSASQSSTSNSTINALLSPCQRLHSRQPVSRSP
jgi:hypothetical protein